MYIDADLGNPEVFDDCIFPTFHVPTFLKRQHGKPKQSSYTIGFPPLMLGNNITSETRPRIFRMLNPSIRCRPALVDGMLGLGSREGGEGNTSGEYVVLDAGPVERFVRALKAWRISRRARSDEDRCLAESVRLFWCISSSA